MRGLALPSVDSFATPLGRVDLDREAIAALAPGCWQWNAWLTPKGRVIAVFALARLAEERGDSVSALEAWKNAARLD